MGSVFNTACLVLNANDPTNYKSRILQYGDRGGAQDFQRLFPVRRQTEFGLPKQHQPVRPAAVQLQSVDRHGIIPVGVLGHHIHRRLTHFPCSTSSTNGLRSYA